MSDSSPSPCLEHGEGEGICWGIDGVSILEFEKEKRKEIPKLAEELKAGTWKPQPYMEIEVAKTKNPEEIRKLGMTAIRDKIVQHAIKAIIEPRYEKIFLGNSYGYRPGKGATKAIRRVLAECCKKQYKLSAMLVSPIFPTSRKKNRLRL